MPPTTAAFLRDRARVLAVVALLPWWRNHRYLRSFFEYGVVMGGIGRIDTGQQP